MCGKIDRIPDSTTPFSEGLTCFSFESSEEVLVTVGFVGSLVMSRFNCRGSQLLGELRDRPRRGAGKYYGRIMVSWASGELQMILTTATRLINDAASLMRLVTILVRQEVQKSCTGRKITEQTEYQNV